MNLEALVGCLGRAGRAKTIIDAVMERGEDPKTTNWVMTKDTDEAYICLTIPPEVRERLSINKSEDYKMQWCGDFDCPDGTVRSVLEISKFKPKASADAQPSASSSTSENEEMKEKGPDTPSDGSSDDEGGHGTEISCKTQ